jgi:hypothetical protein
MTKIAGSGSISQRHGSADPDLDPHQNVMDPQHCYIIYNNLEIWDHLVDMLEYDGPDAGLRDPGEEGAQLCEVGPHRALHPLPPLVVLLQPEVLRRLAALGRGR